MWQRLCLAAMAAMLAAPGAFAQTNYPTKPIHVLIPFAPGGASDFVARVMQNKLTSVLGQQIVVDNRPGAAGVLATELVAHSAPDGYTLFLGNVGTLAVNASVFASQMKVDPVKDLAAITLVADTPDILIVKKDLPVKSVKELVAYAKERPGKLNYASPGSGSLNRLEMELFRKIVGGLDMVHVPYKGGAGPAVADLVAGQDEMMFTTLSSAIGQVKAGTVRGLAVTTAKRVPSVSDLPTMVESGYPDMVSSSWQGMVAPAGTPQPIIQKLYDALIQTVSDKDVADRLEAGGAGARTSKSPAEFSQYMAAERERWAVVVKESGATAD
ncbi:MAG TPA: tripartite tricarboxylate transporter substrate binding protein [Reyranella sp.]|nr:tripartite tricarboxylate transporter substrate binding protein [Reyranella sp.]HTY65857.1 tripartite tricarboxylate transporter substrate binding protein [Alphaproteobacteria bacterium]